MKNGKVKDLLEAFNVTSVSGPLGASASIRIRGGNSVQGGGARKGFPENCFDTFENTLRHTPAILEIDEKDVPIDIRVKKIVENKAEANAMVIANYMEDIKRAYQLNNKIMMEVMMGKMENVMAFDQSGVPWENVVAFIGHDYPPIRKSSKRYINGVPCASREVQGTLTNNSYWGR